MSVPAQAALKIARVSIGAGLFLAVIKIAAGWMAGSLAVIADGVESAGDVVASFILWLGLRMSAQPPDEDHPYGHGRFEILAGQAIGAFLIGSGVLLGWHAFSHLSAATATPEPFALWTVVLSIVLKLGLARWKRRLALELRSSALAADSANDWLDVLSGLIALAAVGLNVYNPHLFAHADAIGGLLIAVLVVMLGFQALQQSSWELLDTMPSPEMLAEIRAVAMVVPGALAIEKCLARKTGLQYHVDLHLEVDGKLSVEAAHQISGKVRSAIRGNVPWVADVLIHIEPAPSDNKS